MASSYSLVILGGNGQLGSDLVKVARDRGHDVHGFGSAGCDIRDPEQIKDTLDRLRPDFVINSAAFHQVDACEDDPGTAFAVNAVGALNVARACHAAEAGLTYISTDYVFDGHKPAPGPDPTAETAYLPDDPTAPLNTYGASKLAGEALTRVGHPDADIARISSVFGVEGARGKGGNFIETILGRASQGLPLKVVDEQWMAPTYTVHAAERILDGLGHAGVRHCNNSGACTWHELASEAVALCGYDVEVAPCSASEFPSKAVRPANSTLLSDGIHWKAGVKEYLTAKGHIELAYG